jgi:hypothetical protein
MERVILGTLAFQTPSVGSGHTAVGVRHIGDYHRDTRNGGVLSTEDMVLFTDQTCFVFPVKLFTVESSWIFVFVT